MAEKLEFDLVFNVGTGNFDKVFREVERKAAISGEKAANTFVNPFRDASKKISKNLTTAKIAVGAFIGSLARDAVRAFNQTLLEGARNALEFEKNIAEINTLLNDTQKINAEAAQSIRALSVQYGTDQQRQAKAFYDIVSAGVRGTANQLSTLKVANEAATAGLVDIKTAAFALVSATNAYSQSGLTATQASDSLFQAVKDGIITFGQLAENIGSVTAFASAAGVSFQEAAGTAAFLTKSGLGVERSFTSLRQIFATILKPTEDTKKAARELGIEFSRLGIKQAGGLVNFLEEVKNATRGSSEEITRLFPNVRATTGALRILQGDFQRLSNIVERNQKSLGATRKAFEEISKTGSFQLSRVISAVSAVFSTVFTKSLDSFASVLTTLPTNIVNFAITSLSVLADFLGKYELVFRAIRQITLSPINSLKLLAKGFVSSLNDLITLGRAFARKLPESIRPKGLDQIAGDIQATFTDLNQNLQAEQLDTSLPITNAIFETISALQQLKSEIPSSNEALQNLIDKWKETGKGIINASKDIASAVNASLANATSRAVQAFTKSLIIGEGGFEAFGKAILAIEGDICRAPAGALQISFGPELCRYLVNLTVQGDILDSQDTPRRLADLLNAGFDNEGLVLKAAR